MKQFFIAVASRLDDSGLSYRSYLFSLEYIKMYNQRVQNNLIHITFDCLPIMTRKINILSLYWIKKLIIKLCINLHAHRVTCKIFFACTLSKQIKKKNFIKTIYQCKKILKVVKQYGKKTLEHIFFYRNRDISYRLLKKSGILWNN